MVMMMNDDEMIMILLCTMDLLYIKLIARCMWWDRQTRPESGLSSAGPQGVPSAVVEKMRGVICKLGSAFAYSCKAFKTERKMTVYVDSKMYRIV